MRKNYFSKTPSIIFFAMFLVGITSMAIHIPSAAGEETLCVPKTTELPVPVKTCPGGNCDRIDIGVQSFWDFDQNKEIRKVLDDVIQNEIPPVLTALKNLRNVVGGLKSNCSYSMTGNQTDPAVTCNTETYHPIYKNDDPLGFTPPTNTINRLNARKVDLEKALQNPADPTDGLKPQALDVFVKLHRVLQLSFTKIQEYDNDPLKYLLSCGELSTLENQDGSKILIGNAAQPGRCPRWDFISVFFLSGF